MSLVRLIYISETNFPIGEAQDKKLFRGILDASARHNPERGVTGLLLFDWDHFVQILEGDRGRVSELFLTIARDPRHKKVTLVDFRPIEERCFPRWAMLLRDDSADTQHHLLRFSGAQQFRPEQLSAEGLLKLGLALVRARDAREHGHAAAPTPAPMVH